ncbi:essential MCU regulator, mitochondrial-like [Hetaerina americana]|uniref:essential MCU regulator, mitochondrial-like n=1 Tax=Hetaerina americana TaxID=62018 RepID=UPI003A7F5747
MAASMVRSSWKTYIGLHLRHTNTRTATNTSSGAMLPEPRRTPFGLIGVVCAVVPGLLVGATISKNIASFLEENDLFVPSDDDDDDD